MKQESAQEAREEPGDSSSGRLSFVVQVTAITVVLASCLIGHAWWRTGSLGLVWPYLSGQRLLIEPTELDLGDVVKGKVFERELQVVNLGSEPLTLLGAQSSCGCISLDDFPIVVPAGVDRALKLRIGTTDKSGPFAHKIKLFTDAPGHMSVIIAVEGVAS
jgi:Protein of unknown function (DUF1573)